MAYSENSAVNIGGSPLGEVLVRQGKLTEEQLQEGLKVHDAEDRSLGKTLVSLGYVTEEDVARAVSEQLGVEYVESPRAAAAPEVTGLISRDVLAQHVAAPLRLEDGRLIVAMSNPDDPYVCSALTISAGYPVTPVVSSEEAILDLLHDGHLENGSPTGGGAAQEPPRESRDDPLFKNPRLGNLLLEMGRITAEQLEEARAAQQGDNRRIGEVLLSLGYVTKTELAQARASELRLDFVEFSEGDVDRDAASMIEQRLLRRHGVMPLRVEDGRIVVAMSDPTNLPALEDLMMISGYPVTPVVALEENIQTVFNKVFAVGEGISEILQEAARESTGLATDEIDLGIEATPDEAPVIRLVSFILQQAVGEGASDIHIEPRAKEITVRLRVDGVLRETMSIPAKLQNSVIARLKIMGNLDIAERRVPQDGRFSVKLGSQKVDFRVASLPTVFGEKLVLRLIDSASAGVDLMKLGFAPRMLDRYREIFKRPYGAILVTGPTGSGKSTTLYATLAELNSPEKNIITVEDPVESRVPGVNQVQVNPKAGLTSASGLRSILRSDPDIVMIGEIRDFETAKISVEAALTGHLVLATLHTNYAPGALGRLTDMGVEPFLTSSAVDCVIAQRLARRLCERCKEPVEMEEEVLSSVRFPFENMGKEEHDFHGAVGCKRCGGSGYKGRVGIYELMVVNQEIREMILKRASTGEIAHVAEETGMIPLREDGLIKAAQGMTTIEEVLRTVV